MAACSHSVEDQPLRECLHEAVLDSIVYHLEEVDCASGAAVQVPGLRAGSVTVPVGHARNKVLSRSQNGKIRQCPTRMRCRAIPAPIRPRSIIPSCIRPFPLSTSFQKCRLISRMKRSLTIAPPIGAATSIYPRFCEGAAWMPRRSLSSVFLLLKHHWPAATAASRRVLSAIRRGKLL